MQRCRLGPPMATSRPTTRIVDVRPWLYAIARNRCLFDACAPAVRLPGRRRWRGLLPGPPRGRRTPSGAARAARGRGASFPRISGPRSVLTELQVAHPRAGGGTGPRLRQGQGEAVSCRSPRSGSIERREAPSPAARRPGWSSPTPVGGTFRQVDDCAITSMAVRPAPRSWRTSAVSARSTADPPRDPVGRPQGLGSRRARPGGGAGAARACAAAGAGLGRHGSRSRGHRRGRSAPCRHPHEAGRGRSAHRRRGRGRQGGSRRRARRAPGRAPRLATARPRGTGGAAPGGRSPRPGRARDLGRWWSPAQEWRSGGPWQLSA